MSEAAVRSDDYSPETPGTYSNWDRGFLRAVKKIGGEMDYAEPLSKVQQYEQRPEEIWTHARSVIKNAGTR